MFNDNDRVDPGDLIQSDLVNRLMDAVNELNRRLTDLESGVVDDGSVAVTGVVVEGGGEVREGVTLNVFGRNFDFLIGGHRVTFHRPDGTQVQRVQTFNRDRSGDNLLVFAVPDLGDIPEGGDDFVMRVANASTSDDWEMMILPMQQNLTGSIILTPGETIPDTPRPDEGILFAYSLEARTNIPATYRIEPTIEPAAWQSRVRILRNETDPMPGGEIVVNDRETVNFFIQITRIPADTADEEFTLTVRASAGNLSDTDTMTYTVGDAIIPPDPDIDLNLGSINMQDGTELDPADLSIDPASGHPIVEVPTGSFARLLMTARFRAAGTYDLTASLVEGTNGWRFEAAPGTQTRFALDERDITGAGGQITTSELEFPLQPQVGADIEGMIQIVLVGEGADNPHVLRFVVRLT